MNRKLLLILAALFSLLVGVICVVSYAFIGFSFFQPGNPTDTAHTPVAGAVPPTPTVGPTPTLTATVGPTPTPLPTQIATPTPVVVTCPFEPPSEFYALWQTHKPELGCAKQQTVARGLVVEQRFEKGVMFWVGELDWFFVNLGGNDGRWYTFQDEAAFDVLFKPNHEGVTCEPRRQPAAGQTQPIRGFGAIWCGVYQGTDFQRELGFATEAEHGELNDQFLAFDAGYMLRDSRGQTYIFLIDGNNTGHTIIQ